MNSLHYYTDLPRIKEFRKVEFVTMEFFGTYEIRTKKVEL